ncbi:Putative Holin-X, holin superfamily III [Agreia bicolorata]|uniref:Putative Holin-X, holin superfamily III n=1 Tax=Agreia bicolorata TaxID=110935 RepID=A0A1T4YL47_9MICO|nr:phage holin family protein [Agreia bicolorata]SKB02519.1 Putative Holin-X, holin superfamily III [Agreia bicolorata]
MTNIPNPARKKSLGELLGELPGLLTKLVKDEIEGLKREITSRLAKLGVGAALFVVAALLGFFALAVLIAAAVLGLATVFQPWAAALIVAGVLLVIVAILVLVGVRSIKKGIPPVPENSVDSLKKDVNAIKGLGR